MKKRKYLSTPLWLFPMMVIIVAFIVSGSWLSEQLFPADQLLQRKTQIAITAIGLFAEFMLIVIVWRKTLKAESHFRAGRILCVYCGYTLEMNTWPQQCPECGNHQTRDESFDYWETHFDVNNALSESDQNPKT
ncbi:MAG: hypothetical protein JKX70_06700 [Phycisphaerales bacterium]|nr:hypothetical protein [Phycisphaerales bacterium]